MAYSGKSVSTIDFCTCSMYFFCIKSALSVFDVKSAPECFPQSCKCVFVDVAYLLFYYFCKSSLFSVLHKTMFSNMA
jgi:hypothetical protein